MWNTAVLFYIALNMFFGLRFGTAYVDFVGKKWYSEHTTVPAFCMRH